MSDFASSSEAKKSPVTGVNWSKWFPALTPRTLLAHYLPASGAISHTLYTVHLFNPSLLSRTFSTADLAVSNTILFNANVGLGFYIYYRRHLHRTAPWERVEFSVIATTIFNFGSILAAVLIKPLLPQSTPTLVRSALAVSLSAYLLSRAYKYVGLIDSKSNRSSPSPTRSRRLAAAGSVCSTASRPTSTINDSISIMAPEDTLVHPSFPTPVSSNGRKLSILTPTITNTEEPSEGDVEDELCRSPVTSRKKNYKYLHSYALGNLNQTREKSSILRRTTAKQPPMMSFVTPEPSTRGVYTPPPTPTETTKEMMLVTVSSDEESDILPRAESESTFFEYHAPFAAIPIVLFSFVKWKTLIPLPIIDTIKFIFLTTFTNLRTPSSQVNGRLPINP